MKQEDGELFPYNDDGKIEFSDVDYLDTWKELELMKEKKLTKAVGLSNFNKSQIERILANCSVKPAVNQIECHPYLNQKKLIDFCKKNDIVVTAYSPLGSPDRPWAKPDDVQLLQDENLKKIAEKYEKTVAQVLLRYQIQRGVAVIPKSVTKSRIESNIKVFDFELSDADMDAIDNFDCNGRFCPMIPYVQFTY